MFITLEIIILKMSKTIGIFSAKGGVGKTTTAINLASALNSFGREIIVIDTDITSPNLGIYLGHLKVPKSLNYILKNNEDINRAVHTHHTGINIIQGSINPNHTKDINYKKINEKITTLKDKYEIIIIDSAPGSTEEALTDLDFIEEILIVTTPELASVTDALRTVTISKRINKKILGIVLTRTNSHEHEMSKENIEAMLGIPVLSSIPEDKNIPLSAKASAPIVHTNPESKASIAYKELAAKIIESNYKIINKK